uniref:Uncharacterized protein n=1 Tax=Parascaris equorum TaxID=6256 RepID=A0A914RBC0_PAREQ
LRSSDNWERYQHAWYQYACVTHFNGRPLSLFSKNDELLSLIDTVPPMSEFTLIIQPYDFMKEIKREIKKMKKLWSVLRVFIGRLHVLCFILLLHTVGPFIYDRNKVSFVRYLKIKGISTIHR